MFKKMRGIRLPYVTQGLIYFTCRNYHNQPLRIQQKINSMCKETGGEYYTALRDIVIHGKPVRQTAMQYFIEERTLYRCRKKFYEKWKKHDNREP